MLFFSGPISGYLIGRLGRRATMFLITLGFSLFYLLLTCAFNVWMILIARFFIGIMSGLTSIAAPVYIAETSSAGVRGMLGSCFQMMVTFGILYVDILGYFGSWRWLTVGCLASCSIWAISLLFVPETPAYLLQKRKFDEARDSMEVISLCANAV